MVDAPNLPSFSRGIVTSEAPVSKLSPGEVAQPWVEMGRALDRIGESSEAVGKAAEALATPFAERAGLESVSRDSDGNLQVGHAPVFGPAGAVYARAQKFAALAQGEGEANRQALLLSKQFHNDPEQYRVAAESFRDRIKQDYTDAAGPEVGMALGRSVDNAITHDYRWLSLEHERNIKQNFDHGTMAAIQSKTQDLTDLIRSGGAGTPQARQLATEIHAAISERVTNPVLNESPDIADFRTKKLNQDINTAGFESKVNRVLKEPAAGLQPMMETAAGKYNIDPILLQRQIYQESRFNPNAVSPAGAEGIAQFMPGTAARYGVNVKDVQSSLEGAAHYMGDLTQQFRGNTGLALAGYNWGEKNVAQWVASGANPASMPAETRNYVMAITGQPIEAWIRGDRPEPGEIKMLPPPGGAAGGMARAQAMVDAALNDESVSPTQRFLNNEAGQKLINDYRTDIARRQHVAEQAQKALDENFENTIIQDRASENPQITEYDIKTNQQASAATKMRMLKWIAAEDLPGPTERESKSNAVDLYKRMFMLPDDDPNKIHDLGPVRDAYVNRIIGKTEKDDLEKQFTEGKSVQGQKLNTQIAEVVNASGLDKSTLMKADDTGKMAQYNYKQYVLQRVDDYRKAGKPFAELFNPSSPDFIGKREITEYFRSTMDETMKNIERQISNKRPPPPPGLILPPAAPGAPVRRNAGESAADYLKRTGQ
jgi:hypothetical protein